MSMNACDHVVVNEAIQTLGEFPIFDVAILSHGFAPYGRDYLLVAETNWSEGRARQYEYRFSQCRRGIPQDARQRRCVAEVLGRYYSLWRVGTSRPSRWGCVGNVLVLSISRPDGDSHVATRGRVEQAC
jgi:hypothetical protein